MTENIQNNDHDQQVIGLSDIIKMIRQGRKTIALFGIIFLVVGIILTTYRALHPSAQYSAEIQLATYINAGQIVAVQPISDVKTYAENLIDSKELDFHLPVQSSAFSIVTPFQIVETPNQALILNVVGPKSLGDNYQKFYLYIFAQIKEMQDQAITRSIQDLNARIENQKKELQLFNAQKADFQALISNASLVGNKMNNAIQNMGEATKSENTNMQIAQNIANANLLKAYAVVSKRVDDLTLNYHKMTNNIFYLQNSISNLQKQVNSFQSAKLINANANSYGGVALKDILIALIWGLLLGVIYIVLKGIVINSLREK